MKSHINYPRCPRCGYQYTPKNKKRVLVFKTDDGDLVACQDCIAAFGEFLQEERTEEEKQAFLAEFKAPEGEDEQ